MRPLRTGMPESPFRPVPRAILRKIVSMLSSYIEENRLYAVVQVMGYGQKIKPF